ncbi:hypothetical protein FKM82_004184 [Ascaphus truei]
MRLCLHFHHSLHKHLPFIKVFGQCKVIFHINKPRRTAHLYNYDCTLRPAARGDIQMPCLGCPISRPFNDTRYQDVVKQSLEKFNRESNYSKHFSLGNITRASEQLIKGSSYFVEFTVQESSCNKSTLIEELSQCQPLDCEFAHYGYCKGSVRPHVNSLDKKNVTVSCEIFEPEAAVVEEQKHLDGRAHDKHDQSDRKNHSRKKGDKRGNKHGQSHHKHGHKHDQKHDHSHDHDHSGSHEHEHEHLHLHEHHHYPSLGTHGPSNSDRTVGIIRLLPHGEEPTTAPKKKKGKKPSDGTKPMPLPSFPDRPVAQNPNGESPVPLPFFPIGSEARPGQGHPAFHGRSSGPVILPFPEKVSTSDQCPGQPKRKVPSADVLPQPTLQPK